MPQTVKLAVIPGDGIGPEVIAEARQGSRRGRPAASDLAFEKTHFSLGADRYLATGDVLTDDDLAAIAGHDAILLGAVGGVPGDPRLAGANIERGLLLKLRFSLDHYVNLRPTTLFPGIASPLADPGEVDFVVVREGTEGPYVGNGGAIRAGHPARDRQRGLRQHRIRRRARRPLRLRAGRERGARSSPSCTRPTCSPSPAASGSAPWTRWPPSIRTSPSTTCTSTPRPSSSSPILLDST